MKVHPANLSLLTTRATIAIIIIATLPFLGCRSPQSASSNSTFSAASNPPSTSDQGQLIKSFGEYRIANTVVHADSSERNLTVKHLSYKQTPAGSSTSTSAVSISPDQWPLHDGWFAYAHRDGSYVWLYNGTDKILLIERKVTPAENSTNTYDAHNLPIPVPPTVLKHLKEPLRSKLINK
jgi:hypothetical protein